MALMTGEQYVESMRKLKLNVYMFGKKIENPVDDPILRPSLNSVKMTYDLAQLPEYKNFILAPGCDMPYAVPVENTIGVAQAALETESVRKMVENYMFPLSTYRQNL